MGAVMTETIRAVAFREGAWWVAQCLEYDIATQAKSLEALVYEVERILAAYFVVAEREGLEPFQNIPKAPKRFWEMYRAAKMRIAPVEPMLTGAVVDLRSLAA